MVHTKSRHFCNTSCTQHVLYATRRSVLQKLVAKCYFKLSLTLEKSGEKETSSPLRYSSISAMTLNLQSLLSQGLLSDQVSGIQ